MTVTQKSPKRFRFSLVAKLQSLSIEAVEYMYRANDLFVSKDRRGSMISGLGLSL